MKPVQRRNGKCIPEDTVCPLCGAPHHFIYDNNGGNGQYQCKVCGQTFSTGDSATTPMRFLCPHCGHTFVPKKDRKFFRKHKCAKPKYPYYLHNLAKVERKDLKETHGKTKYKLHYIYREFTVDFFAMDLNSLPKNASSLKFSKHNAHVMSLCLTLHINLGLSLRKTSQALKDLYKALHKMSMIMKKNQSHLRDAQQSLEMAAKVLTGTKNMGEVKLVDEFAQVNEKAFDWLMSSKEKYIREDYADIFKLYINN